MTFKENFSLQNKSVPNDLTQKWKSLRVGRGGRCRSWTFREEAMQYLFEGSNFYNEHWFSYPVDFFYEIINGRVDITPEHIKGLEVRIEKYLLNNK